MKILMVSIPNHHFFQWVNQLKDSGYEVYWFDASDGGSLVERINWVTQIKGWKLKWDFPLRLTIKQYFPKIYGFCHLRRAHRNIKAEQNDHVSIPYFILIARLELSL